METLKVSAAVEMLLSLCSRKYSDKERLLMVTAWEHSLKELSPQQLQTGLDKAIDAHDGFMMPPGKFKDLCLSQDGSRSLEDDGAQAWSLVMQNLNSSIAPIFQDTSIAETINTMGGWVPFCQSLNEFTTEAKRKQFIGFYVVNRNKKTKFSPLPDRVSEFFQDGKNRPDYQFIGFEGSGDAVNIAKKEALRLATQQHAVCKKISGLLQGGKSTKQPRISLKDYVLLGPGLSQSQTSDV